MYIPKLRSYQNNGKNLLTLPDAMRPHKMITTWPPITNSGGSEFETAVLESMMVLFKEIPPRLTSAFYTVRIRYH